MDFLEVEQEPKLEAWDRCDRLEFNFFIKIISHLPIERFGHRQGFKVICVIVSIEDGENLFKGARFKPSVRISVFKKLLRVPHDTQWVGTKLARSNKNTRSW